MPKSRPAPQVRSSSGTGKTFTSERAEAIARRFAEQLRREVEAQGLSQYRIAQETGIPQSVLSRFLTGGGMKLDSAAVLLDYLGLEVRRKAKRSARAATR